jgi:hypothetical protein
LNGREIAPEVKIFTMNLKCVFAGLLLMTAAACNNGDDEKRKSDSANVLNDTFPANRVGDTTGLDSNPADKTKIDSGNRSTH